MDNSLRYSLFNMFFKIRGVPELDNNFFKVLHCDLEAFLHKSQGLIIEDHTEAIDELVNKITTYDLPMELSRRDIAIKFLYDFLLNFFGSHINTLIDISDLKSHINKVIQTVTEIEEKKARDENQEDPPTPFVYYFPHPKGPPAATADRNPKQRELPSNDTVSETLGNSSNNLSNHVPTHKKLSKDNEEIE